MEQNFPSMGSQYIATTAQRLTTTVEVANLKSRVSLLWRLKKIVANAQAQQQREAEEAAQHAASLDLEIEEVHQQTVEEELVQLVNQVSCNNLCCSLLCIITSFTFHYLSFVGVHTKIC